ncbi:MAG: ribonuclease HII, partial [Chloroflexales bacterium]|nr:ribonuclease HII [Chloroflexales bacterium]
MPPTLLHEHELLVAGHSCVAGIDEAGRGCWAGPVVAAAVVLGPNVLAQPELLEGVDDSKALTPLQRERLYKRILALVAGVGVGVVPASTIDALGIVPATRIAMMAALLALPCCPDALLIDAVRLDPLELPQRAIIRGDSASLSIAAASIVAKVSRDQRMHTAERAHPGYHFAQHKGYGTAAHHNALKS